MSDQAKVSSIDALEAFRADLIQYLEKVRVALENAEGDVRRTRTWLDVDRAGYWSRQLKQRQKMLDQAEAELYNVVLTSPRDSHTVQKMAVARAKRAIEEAEEKLRRIKHWRQAFDHRVIPVMRQMDPMFFVIGQHLPKGVQALTGMITALQAYASQSSTVRGAQSVVELTAEEGGVP